MTVSLSIGITTHNEGEYLEKLLPKLVRFVQEKSMLEYEIVVVDDYSDDPTTVALLSSHRNLFKWLHIYDHLLQGDFAAHKNFLNSKCHGDFILQLDSDEDIDLVLLDSLTTMIELNPSCDAYRFPRANEVIGITPEFAARYGWPPLIPHPTKPSVLMNCWPDYQTRLYRNTKEIHWERAVHEQLVGWKVCADLPRDIHYAISHTKTMARQEKQNAFYDTILGVGV